ncbi:MAG: hypothetical protein LUH82_02795 [Clostridiales bacterium]|nr:hypothetical protein [Clostridiales bacterium]
MPKKTDKDNKITNNNSAAPEGAENSGRERKIFAVAVALLIAAAIIVALIFHTGAQSDSDNAAVSQNTSETVGADVSEDSAADSTESGTLSTDSDSTDDTDDINETSETADSTADAETESDAEASTAAKTTKQAQGYSLPLSVNQALNALEEHYGSGYKINSTVEEGGYNYFVIYENGEKYASVKVDLETGQATETLAATQQATDFYLV